MSNETPHPRHARFVFAIATLALIVASLPATDANAAKLFRGSRIVIAESDTIHDDVYVSGGNVTVRGVIDGDVVAAGGQVGINGDVRGSVLAMGGAVEVYGNVAGSVRVMGGRLTIGSQVGHDIVAAGGQIDVSSDARVARDALIAGGRTEVNGTIGRDAKIGTGQLVLQPDARIGGDLEYASDQSMLKTPGAQVAGKTTWFASGWRKHHKTGFDRWFAHSIEIGRFTVGIVMLGLLFVLLFPVASERSVERLATQFLPSAGIGLLVTVVMPLAAGCVLLLGMVFGGWYVGAFLFALWLIAMSLGLVVFAVTIGRWLGARMGARGLALVWALLLGAFVLMIMRMVPLAGRMIAFLAMLCGLGALTSVVGATIAAARPKRATM